MRPRGVFADWARKEARAGDRLPYLSLTDAAGEGVLLKAAEALQGERYVSLTERRPANEAFLYGWLANRIG